MSAKSTFQQYILFHGLGKAFFGHIGDRVKIAPGPKKDNKKFFQPWQGASIYDGVHDTYQNHFKQKLGL